MSSGHLMFLEEDAAGPPRPVRELYGVFRRSAQPTDLLVQQLAKRDAYFDSDLGPDTPARLRDAFKAQIGDPLYDETRLLVGTMERGVYAMPTTAEAICLRSFPDGGGNCGWPTRHGVCVGFDCASDGSSFLLYGIVGDDVASVEVVVGGQAREAELGENGYRVAIEDGRQQLQELRLRLLDEATEILDLRMTSPT